MSTAPAWCDGVPWGIINYPKWIEANSCTQCQETHPSPSVLPIIYDLAFQLSDNALSLSLAHEPDGETTLTCLLHVLGTECIVEQPGKIDISRTGLGMILKMVGVRERCIVVRRGLYGLFMDREGVSSASSAVLAGDNEGHEKKSHAWDCSADRL